MYKLIVKRIARQTFDALNRGEYEVPLKKFAPDAHFAFAGDNAIGCDLHSVEDTREWFARSYRLFPDLTFDVHDVLVSGGPWRTLVASHFSTSATFRDGSPYANRGMQFLVLRWGKVVEDLIYEDSEHMTKALEKLAEQGVSEALEAPIGGGSAPATGRRRESRAQAAASTGSQ